MILHLALSTSWPVSHSVQGTNKFRVPTRTCFLILFLSMEALQVQIVFPWLPSRRNCLDCALQVGCQAASCKVYVNCTPHNRKMYLCGENSPGSIVLCRLSVHSTNLQNSIWPASLESRVQIRSIKHSCTLCRMRSTCMQDNYRDFPVGCPKKACTFGGNFELKILRMRKSFGQPTGKPL